MAIDYTQHVGQVRLLIADTDEDRLVLTDAQVAGYLTIQGASPAVAHPWQVRRAAADALDAIATSEVLVSKVMRTQDVSTDGAKVADALRKQAATLRAQADDLEDDDTAERDGGATVLEFHPYPRVL